MVEQVRLPLGNMSEREKDVRLLPTAQLCLSVEFRNGMLTAHPPPPPPAVPAPPLTGGRGGKDQAQKEQSKKSCSEKHQDNVKTCITRTLKYTRYYRNTPRVLQSTTRPEQTTWKHDKELI